MYSIKVSSAIPLDNMQVLVFFENGEIKKFDVKNLITDYPEFEDLKNQDLFNLLKVEPGGYGISWNKNLDCSEGELYENGIDVPLFSSDFISFAKYNLVSTKEAARMLDCTKQNIEDLIRRKKLHPIKYDDRFKLFLRSEIEQRTWKYTNKENNAP